MTDGLEKFTELENKVYRAIELFKATKIQKESLEKDVLKMKSQLEQAVADNDRLKAQIQEFKKENELVKQKVEGLLQKLESLTV
ncbi:MAG: hypothetical protein AB1898_19065 [Acidobacteriota bacterium]